MTIHHRRLYNARTYFWHRVLHLPIRLHAAFDNRRRRPALTVIFLHGISANSATWRSTIRQLQREPDLENLRLITLDLLGFGKSLQADWLDYDYAAYDSALRATLKHLKIRSPYILVGHSMGALIAANFAAATSNTTINAKTTVISSPIAPPSHLILVSPPVLMVNDLARLPDQIYARSYRTLTRLATAEPAIEVIANFIQRFTSFRSQYLKTPAFAKSMENIILSPTNYRTFTSLKTPTLIIHGRFDPLVMRSNLKRAAAHNSRHLRYVGVMGQHDISVNKRAKIILELKRILKEQANAT